MLRCRQIPSIATASGLVVNAVVVDGRVPRLPVPDGNRPPGLRLEHDPTDGVPDQLCNAAARPRSGFSQRVKLRLGQVNLSLSPCMSEYLWG